MVTKMSFDFSKQNKKQRNVFEDEINKDITQKGKSTLFENDFGKKVELKQKNQIFQKTEKENRSLNSELNKHTLEKAVKTVQKQTGRIDRKVKSQIANNMKFNKKAITEKGLVGQITKEQTKEDIKKIRKDPRAKISRINKALNSNNKTIRNAAEKTFEKQTNSKEARMAKTILRDKAKISGKTFDASLEKKLKRSKVLPLKKAPQINKNLAENMMKGKKNEGQYNKPLTQEQKLKRVIQLSRGDNSPKKTQPIKKTRLDMEVYRELESQRGGREE
jgi:hypothetical protein